MKDFLATMFILVFACSTITYSQKTTSTTKTTAGKKTTSTKKVVKVIEKVPIEVVFSNPNKKIGYFNHLGKVAYNIPRDTIANYFLSSLNIDSKEYLIKNIAIQKKTNNELYELIIGGINSISYNGFVIAFLIEHYNGEFYMSSSDSVMVRGAIGKGCQQIKLSDNNCDCGDTDWLGEGYKANLQYHSFMKPNSKFELELLNCIFDYTKFCSLINAKQS